MPDTMKPKVRPKAKHGEPQTAADAYARCAERVRAVLGCVEDALEEHAGRAAGSPGD